ncbi:MAG: geranylgeranylglyceryl/heptaprenylglyceryl phosphate synthase [Thermoplasmata archaeon]|nr:geranylgeranylglyceryl/heptaprenylglyceryl phosphate synthase [Thermoplasmata archaeon]MCI4359471.1 geranylgeranylglyceryl/heptaprenylglyceryl phosphate synthase [Thermoplasmata archaeon]
MGRVGEYLADRLRRGPLHFTLVDPDKSSGERASAIGRGAAELGSDAILLGGSTGISTQKMGAAAKALKSSGPLPVIIFPEGPVSLTGEADAILFMSLLNSRNLDLVIRLHAKSAPEVRRLGLEPISLGYLVVAPGMRVGEVGQVDVVPRDRPDTAVGYALAAQMLGMQMVYLEAGSGAPSPVPVGMVRAVRDVLNVPLIVGGGIRTGSEARALIDAGAQILVTGTITEEEGLGEGFRAILTEVRRSRAGG